MDLGGLIHGSEVWGRGGVGGEGYPWKVRGGRRGVYVYRVEVRCVVKEIFQQVDGLRGGEILSIWMYVLRGGSRVGILGGLVAWCHAQGNARWLPRVMGLVCGVEVGIMVINGSGSCWRGRYSVVSFVVGVALTSVWCVE